MPCYVGSKEFLIQLQKELLVEKQKTLRCLVNNWKNVFATDSFLSSARAC